MPWPSGKAKVCKTFIPQFKSGWHLQRNRLIRQSVLFFRLEILENVKDQKLREILISSKNHHEQLGNELHILLQKYGDTTKDPGVIAKGMSWIKTNAKLAIDDSDRVCADLITDGCHMGTKTMQRHINQYLAADREARGKAEELIRMEELLACELKPFL